jgi:hypothetical protein
LIEKAFIMATKSLKDRITALETEVALLKAKIEELSPPSKPWWEQIAGTVANDPIFEEAMRLGREYRESLRPKPRRRKR